MIELVIAFVVVIICTVLCISISALGWANFQDTDDKHRKVQIGSLLIFLIFAVLFIMFATILISMSWSTAASLISLKLIGL